MKIKKIVAPLLSILLFAACCTGLYFFCETQTRGFRPYLILSNLPNDPRWEVPPLSKEEQEQVNQKLNQSFTFLGSGGWCYAFLGEDQTTVLKFYRHTHLELGTLLREFSLKKLLFISPPWPQGTPYFQEFNFSSCVLLYKAARERTGLRYVHLNKTQGLHGPVTLIDNIGIRHQIDLDQTEFVVQTKADLIIPHLEALMQKRQIETAKICIKEILTCLFELYKKGIRDADFSFRNNFGYIEEKAITLDLSSFVSDPSLKEMNDYTQEIRNKTKRLEHYLKKYHPALYPYYQECINQLSSKEPL
jgi:hypothetical protein